MLDLALKLGYTHLGSVYTIERAWKVPLLPTIAKHAEAIGCAPWELLTNVETEYDLVRNLATQPNDAAQREWARLLDRYAESTKRGGTSETRSRRRGAKNTPGEDRPPTKRRRAG